MRNHLVAVLVVTGLSVAACAAPARQAPIQQPAPAVMDPVGVYDITTQVEGNAVDGVLTIRRNQDSGLSATVSTPLTGDLPINSITRTENTLQMDANMGGDALRFTVTISETGVLTGNWTVSSGASGAVTGTRRVPG